jgi:hypothetical protein
MTDGNKIIVIRILLLENELYPDSFVNLVGRAGFAPELREVMFGAGYITTFP